MAGSKSGNDPEPKSPREGGEDSEDESEILEESPCGRWLKRREEVEQRDVPGIDCAYLAMDTEEGVEVVWNEVQFSERKNFRDQEEKIRMVFDNLTQLEHPNIVKFHRYWMDSSTTSERHRVIFITEYMSSGSLKQFLKRTKRNVKRLPLQAWKRWCTQILSALSYLHSCSPPIIHGNLTCDTIFIQHNGLIKIGSVAPDAIHHHVKSCRDNMKNMHFVAPEYGRSLATRLSCPWCAEPSDKSCTHHSNEETNSPGDTKLSLVSPAVDVYSFGMCALEMAALEIQGNGDSGNQVTEENVQRTIDSLEDPQLKDFIRKCLDLDHSKRPTARSLLFHPVLFEVHSLKLLAAHSVVSCAANISETITDEVLHRHYGPEVVVADIRHPLNTESPQVEFRMSNVPVTEKLEKFVEDVKFGIYPLTAFALPPRQKPPPGPGSRNPRATSPETSGGEAVESSAPQANEEDDVEARRIVNMMCNVKPKEGGGGNGSGNGLGALLMTILLRMDDKMNRQLSCEVNETDTSIGLADELVKFGFINEDDREKIANLIEETLRNRFISTQPSNQHSQTSQTSQHLAPVPQQVAT